MAVNKTINKRTNTHGAMRNCIEYVLRQDKTSELLTYVTGPYRHDEIDYDLVYRTFLEEKKMWNKDTGRMYAHNIISWHKDEQITPEQAFEFGKEFAENWFSGFQTLVAVHKDKNHIHCHLVTNSVSYEDGRKLHNTKKDLECMKQLTNQMCRERGLTIAEKGKHFDGSEIEKGEVIAWNKDKYNLFRQQVRDSFVADCAMAVLKALENCISKEKFIEKMKQFGWNVNWTEKRKHITFQNQDGKKVRDSNLSKTFHLDISKEGLENEFNGNREKSRVAADRDSRANEELRNYYRELDAAIAQTPEESPIKLKVERDILVQSFEKAKEFMRTQKKQIQTLEEEKQTILSDRQRLREEIRKSTVEIQRLTTELSETQKLNQSLQQSNDDLRNRNGLMSRNEQEQLEEEIKDVRDQNSKLQTQVNQSSVKAVEQAQQKQEEAEKQARQAEYQAEREKKRADMEIQKARRKAKSEMEDMKEIQFFWTWGYLCVIFFSLIQNGAFQRDLMQLIMLPVNWCRKYAIWFEQLDYMGYSTGEVVFERIFSSAVIMAGIVGGVFLVWGGIEWYRKIWDDIYKMVLIASFSFIAVLGNLIREYLPFNLLFVIFVINVGTVLIRIYLNNKNVGY